MYPQPCILSNNVLAPPIVFGTFQHNKEDMLYEMIRQAVKYGFWGFDTAPSYNNESMLGNVFQSIVREKIVSRDKLFLIDKIDGWQMYQRKGDIRLYVDDILKKLKIDYLDLLLIHWPFPEYLQQTWRAFEQVYKIGLVRSIGLCNVEPRHLKRIVNGASIKPHVVQIERHPLNNARDVINYCSENSIIVQGYSPVCRMVPEVAESEVINRIAEKYMRTKGQIIMRWHFDTQVVPVFKTTRQERLIEYGENVNNFWLDDDDITEINKMNQNYRLFLPSRACPGY